MKRFILIATLVVTLPLATAAMCGKGGRCSPAVGNCPSQQKPSPSPSHCLMTKDGCLSPRPRS